MDEVIDHEVEPYASIYDVQLNSQIGVFQINFRFIRFCVPGDVGQALL